MQAGQLDRQINLLRYAETADTGGGVTETYTAFASGVWASVKDLRGSQVIAAQQTTDSITTKFTIRFRDDLTACDRIEWNERQYEIIGVPIEVGRNQWLEIMAKARDEL